MTELAQLTRGFLRMLAIAKPSFAACNQQLQWQLLNYYSSVRSQRHSMWSCLTYCEPGFKITQFGYTIPRSKIALDLCNLCFAQHKIQTEHVAVQSQLLVTDQFFCIVLSNTSPKHKRQPDKHLTTSEGLMHYVSHIIGSRRGKRETPSIPL